MGGETGRGGREKGRERGRGGEGGREGGRRGREGGRERKGGRKEDVLSQHCDSHTVVNSSVHVQMLHWLSSPR